jgi:Glyoxalase-like domain
MTPPAGADGARGHPRRYSADVSFIRAGGARTAGPVGWIREIVLDCPDPWDLAGFWAGLLGGTPVQWYPGWVTLEPPPHGQRLSFQGSGGPNGGSPPGHGATGPATHFDVLVSDLADAHERVVMAGAVFTGEHVSPRPGPGGEQVPWRVYRDPAGHPFCLVVR